MSLVKESQRHGASWQTVGEVCASARACSATSSHHQRHASRRARIAAAEPAHVTIARATRRRSAALLALSNVHLIVKYLKKLK